MPDVQLASMVVADPDVQLVVTDDVRDFRMLAPDFSRRVVSVGEVVRRLGG
jgi:hypothetical protein